MAEQFSSRLDGARERLREQAEQIAAPVPGPAYMTVDEAAALARCNPKTIRRAFESGELPASRPKHRVLIREDDLRAWIEATPAQGSEPHPWAKAPAARRRAPNGKPARGSVADLRQLERNLTQS